jgi:cobalt-zinc-cadmium efflux system membrane fusion protein
LSDEQTHLAPLPSVPRLERKAQVRILIIAVAAAALLVVAVLVLKALTAAPAEAPAAPEPKGAFRPTKAQLAQLTIQPVRYGATADLVSATGSIAVDADHSTPILLPYSGQVLNVMVEAGAHVSAGEPLLRVASSDLVDARNTLLTASAQQASASEAVRIASANAERQRAIYETAGGAQKDYLQAQADLVTARSNLRTAQSALHAARDRLTLFGKSAAETRAFQSDSGGAQQPSTLYRSPVSGIVAERSVSPGQFISAGGSTPLMTITDLSHVWLVAELSEGEASSVHVGDQVVVTTPALPGQTFQATIDNIAAALDPATRRLAVRATVANPGNALKPQMFASFSIRRTISQAAGPLVPSSAVIHEGDSARVWVLGRDGLLRGREVSVGDDEGGLTQVRSGLRPGDRVVTAGALFVNEAGLGE